MGMRRRGTSRVSTLLLTSLGLWLASATALATVMVEVPLEDMASDADAIVVGVVERVGARLVERNGQFEPHTFVSVRVREWVKGSGAETLTLHELGGEIQGSGYRIEGTPRYTPREEVVLFLRRDGTRPSTFRTYGMAQGKFVITRGVPGVPAMVRRDLDGISFARWVEGRQTVGAATPEPAMALDTFLELVRAAGAR